MSLSGLVASCVVGSSTVMAQDSQDPVADPTEEVGADGEPSATLPLQGGPEGDPDVAPLPVDETGLDSDPVYEPGVDSVGDGRAPSVESGGAVGAGTDEADEFVVRPVAAGRSVSVSEPVEVDVVAGERLVVGGAPMTFRLGDGSVLSMSSELPTDVMTSTSAGAVVPRVVVVPGDSQSQDASGFEYGGFGFERLDDIAESFVVRVEFDLDELSAAESTDWAHRVRVFSSAGCEAQVPVGVDVVDECAPVEIMSEFDTDTAVLTAEIVVPPRSGVGIDDTQPADVAEPVPGLGDEAGDVVVDGSNSGDGSDEVAASTTLPETIDPVDADGATTTDAQPAVVEGETAGFIRGAAPLLRSGGGGNTTYGLVEGFSSTWGSYESTSLTSAAEWSVGLQAGSFDWSYPVPVAPTGFGDSPSVSVGYSSSAVDGLTSDENIQSSDLGFGWNIGAGGYIERSFRSCTDDTGTSLYNDLCWFSEGGNYGWYNLVLNGRSERMAQVGPSEWRLEDDPLWRIVQQFNTPGSPDDNGERFEVFTPDGTVYSFGSQPAVSNSTWTVPVYANQSNEPCYNSNPALASCVQGWRFNLDKVEDTNGNRTEYLYEQETNKYGTRNTDTLDVSYTRGGHLTEIRYGANPSKGFNNWTGRVLFDLKNRCTSSDAANGCAWNLTNSNATADYFDVPDKLECPTTSTLCKKHAPSFFTKRITTAIRPQWMNATTWTDLDLIELRTEWPDVDGTGQIPPQLWLREIVRTGKSTTSNVALDAIRFEAVGGALDSRADSIFMPVWRINTVTDEAGAATRVSYSAPQSNCVQPPPNGWDSNTQMCFPKWASYGSSVGYVAFNKFRVTQIEDDDTRDISPSVFHTYLYGPTDSWHYDKDPTTTKKTWSQWRGHPWVRETVGAVGETQTVMEYRYFRGMHGDHQDSGAPNRVESVTNFAGTTFVDYDFLAGYEYDVRTLTDATATVADTVVLTDYWSNLSGPTSRYIRPANIVTKTRTAAGTYLDSQVSYGYNGIGLAYKEITYGSFATLDDDSCVLTDYTTGNTLKWIFGLPGKLSTYGTATCDGERLVRTRLYYDNATSDTPQPPVGNLTRTDEYDTPTTFNTTLLTYDTVGRPTVVDGPRTNDTMTTGYGGALGLAVSTNNSYSHTTATTYNPRGQALTTTDPNAKVTTFTYDGLGRILTVKHHGETNPAIAYTYMVSKTAQSWTKQSVRQDASTIIDSWIFYDGLGREVQHQRGVPDQPTYTETATNFYDSRGLVVKSNPHLTYDAAPGAGYDALAAGSPTVVHYQETATYDFRGRPLNNTHLSYGAVGWQTQIAYDGYTQTVLSPDGTNTTPTRQTVTIGDAIGRTIETRDYGTSPTVFARTSYQYDHLDRTTRTTDHLNNNIDMTYDMLGRTLTVTEPNAGVTTKVYDPAGNVTSTTTANGTIWQSYDGLNRPVQQRATNSTGALLGAWSYDATGQKGLLDYEDSYDGSGNRTMRMDPGTYDNRNRPQQTTYIVDSRTGWTNGTNPLAGSYTFANTYDDADHIISQTYPAAGGLSSETVTTGYNETGQAKTLIGFLRYVKDTTFRWDGAVKTRQINDVANTAMVQLSFDRESTTFRTVGAQATVNGQIVQDDTYVYDTAGNPTQIRNGAVNQTQCFGYDGRQRLQTAYTTSNTICGTSNTSGPAPYNDTYSYDDIDRITNGPAGTGYQYTSTRPHALTSVTTPGGVDTYTYDVAGNRNTFTDADGPDSTYTWDLYGRLTSTDRAGQQTSSRYSVNGQRFLRKDPDGTVTLYLAGLLEIRRTTTATPSATRYYNIAGTPIGIRAPGLKEFFIYNHQGSVTATVDYATSAVKRTHYTPYGDTRNETNPAPTTDHRFLNQIRDETSGLSYLNNRHYDPTTGTFVSVDPLVASTGDPYLYGAANPVRISDPSGLEPRPGHEGIGHATPRQRSVDERISNTRGGIMSGQCGRRPCAFRDLAQGGYPLKYGGRNPIYYAPGRRGINYAEVAGDLGSARNVVFVLDGLGPDEVSANSDVWRRAIDIQTAAGDGTAVIAVGYQTPQFGLQSDDAQSAGADLVGLVSWVEGLGSGINTTVIGHSYGSVAVGAFMSGGGASDSVILTGSPGIGSSSIADTGYRGSVYVGRTNGDNSMFSVGSDVNGYPHGPDPYDMSGVTRLDTSGSSGHNEYYGGTSLGSIVVIVTGG